MPQVYNLRSKKWPEGAKKVDRSTPYGNPFVMKNESQRDYVCDAFDAWVMLPEQAALREQAKRELRGQDLLCWCSPSRCHGLTWLKIANAPFEPPQTCYCWQVADPQECRDAGKCLMEVKQS